MARRKKNKTVIIICGPTAVGKTAVAINLAKQFNTEIISADSRQCFREMNIGVARPSPRELQEIPHHFIATHSIQDEVTASSFEHYALKKAEELFNHHDKVVISGGTGLYIKAFCEGLNYIPEIPEAIRNEITGNYEKEGLAWLQNEIKKKDLLYYSSGEVQNPYRLMRALEVVLATGKSIYEFQKGEKIIRDFNIVKIGLELPKADLHDRINLRVDQMLQAGLVDEVKSLLPYKQLNALQTVGYAELFEYFDNKKSWAAAVEEIKIHTRQYAKRQMTWFKKDKEVRWYPASDMSGILSCIA
ncbi:MAG: tRNA (adenosine(37)-N6)-dimethylallyltransferase MiaA [Chitinophagaceae bacterium]